MKQKKNAKGKEKERERERNKEREREKEDEGEDLETFEKKRVDGIKLDYMHDFKREFQGVYSY